MDSKPLMQNVRVVCPGPRAGQNLHPRAEIAILGVMRVLSSELDQHAGQEAQVSGWLHKKRKLGGLNFILLRDRHGLIQALIKSETAMEQLRGLMPGTVLELTGTVKKDARAPGGAELSDPKVKVLVPVTAEPLIEVDKPIDHTPENFDTLFEHRALNLRNLNEQKLFRLRATAVELIRQQLRERDFTEVTTPKLVAGAAEGGAEVFRLDYFGREATLAQSPQLYKQMLVGAFERVFEIGPAFRAEPSLTSRHLSEVTMLDVEIGFIEGLDAVLEVAAALIREVAAKLWQAEGDTLKAVGAVQPKLAKELPRFSLTEAHELYSKATKEDTTSEPDLSPAEERWLCEYTLKKHGSEAVFVTGFPASDMKFYHQKSADNPELVARADLLFRGSELATIPLREHRHDVLVAQMRAAGIDPEDPGFRYYVQAFEHGLPPHGGFGFGIDRFTQQLLGLSNVKEAVLFPRDMNRLTP